jgi:hypothetical protein
MTGLSRATLARNHLSVIVRSPAHAVTAVTAVPAVIAMPAVVAVTRRRAGARVSLAQWSLPHRDRRERRDHLEPSRSRRARGGHGSSATAENGSAARGPRRP